MPDQPVGTTDFVDVNATRLYYEVAGEGRPLVLIHAGIADSRMWDDQWAEFARSYKVIRYDVRGYGKTAIPTVDFAHRDDLLALLRHLGVQQAAFIAVSMAGRIAIEFILEHPEMASALILVGSGVGAVEPSEALQEAWELADKMFVAGDIDGANEIELQLWVDGPARTPDQVDPAVRERVRVMNRNALALTNEEANEQSLDPPVRERLGELRLPTLVVVGDLDQPHVVESANLFVRDIPSARKVVMTGTAHVPNMEQPEAFNRLALDFLRDTQTA